MTDKNNEFISFFKPSIANEEIDEAVACLKSGWLTTGARTKKFEADFAEYIGIEYAVALNSCTAALHLALEAVNLQANDLVLLPTLTFAATAEVVRYFNAIPVLVDAKDDDFCMDMNHAADILKKIESGAYVKGVPTEHNGVKAIIPVHYGGQIADVIACRKLCDEYGLFMIEDCAHCCPAHYLDADGEWQTVGKSADIACFSFYANKTITTGEGGMVLTANEQWADRIRVMSLHGISKDAWKRFSKSGSWYYEIVAPGFKYNMTDIAASLGIHQLAKADEFYAKRKAIAEKFTEQLSGVCGITLPYEKDDRKHSWHLYVIRVDESELSISRNTFIDKLTELNIGSSVHYIPLHMHPYYKEQYGFEDSDFPVSEKLFQQIISLPIYPELRKDEIVRICDAVKLIASL